MATLLKILGVVLVLVWGWKVKSWHYEAMKTNKPLRWATILISGTCAVLIAILMIYGVWKEFIR